jgi:hypothetical protein
LALAVLVVVGIAYSDRAAMAKDRAPPASSQSSDKKHDEIDTEHIFGFTEGSDIGDAGEKELEAQSFLRFGKQSGVYNASSTTLLYKYSPTDYFRVAPLISFATHEIRNVPGLQDLSQFTFEGTGVELKYRVWDRDKAPFGITLSAVPFRSRIDAGSGLPAEQYAVEFGAQIDKELIKDRLFGAINIAYQPSWTRERPGPDWAESSSFMLSGAIATQIATGLVVGAEARYFRKFDGIALNTFAGEALFIGPTVFKKLSRDWFVSAAWSAQVTGHAAGEQGWQDLTNFERHHVKLRLGVALN